MIAQEKKYLREVLFSELGFWDFYTLSVNASIKSRFPLMELSNFLSQRKDSIEIDDKQTYKRCRVKVRSQGIELRDEVLGREIKTKRQYPCKKNDFLVAEIDAKVGGYGIVPEYLEGAIVSSHYFLFEVNTEKLLTEFFEIVLKCENFFKQIKATGSTNYAAIRPFHVLSYKIPLPSLAQQNAIVEAYNAKIQSAKEAEEKAERLENEIEEYLMEELGIEKMEKEEKKKGLQEVRFKDLERWDALASDLQILRDLKNAKYEIQKIGKIYDFAKRGWNKKEYTDGTFEYIELGAIDEIQGILETKRLKVSEAPSRATQMVKSGDLIIGTTRPYLKRFAIVNENFDENICSSGFSIIEPNEKYEVEFLKEFLFSFYGIEQLKSRMTGATYPAITNEELKEIGIPLPPLFIQQKIVQKISAMKDEIQNLKKLAKESRKSATEDFEKEIFVF